MQTRDALKKALADLDGRSYKQYKDIVGDWDFGDYVVSIDHAQSDPFAKPSRIRVQLPGRYVKLPEGSHSTPSRARGVEALLARTFAKFATRESKRRGTGRSGRIEMTSPGQEVLSQTAVRILDDGGVEARFTVGLPSSGRRISAKNAVELLTEDLAAVIELSLRGPSYSEQEIFNHAYLNEDAEELRAQLVEHGLVAFIADGSILPRNSGTSDHPLKGDGVVPFASPGALRIQLEVPNAGELRGMGIPEGVTLIVGGGFHGKSTLLQALQWGVYNHRPRDGRDFVVTIPDAVKVRAEDGRSVAGVDISPFIGKLPLGKSTEFFSTTNASGSTSQAAGIVEAVEAGAKLLLIDEDTAATNFMIRDRRMQELVPKSREPITPFVDRVRQLHREQGVSTILVIGGSGDYLDVADTVIAMDQYVPQHVTAQAKKIALEVRTGRLPEAPGQLGDPQSRIPDPSSIDSRQGRWKAGIKVPDKNSIRFGPTVIEVGAIEQLVSLAQSRTVAAALLFARDHFVDGKRTITEILDAVEKALSRDGLDALDERRVGHLTAFRRHELAAVLNRLRTLEIVRSSDSDA